MADESSATRRQHGLQQAASMIFALVAVVPLLTFAWTLHDLDVLRTTQAQVGLGLALGIALLGFWMFRSLLGRMAQTAQALAAAVEQAGRARPGPGTAARPAPGATAAPSPMLAASSPGRKATAEAVRPAPDPGVAGIGAIRELSEVMRTMDALWHREAAAYLQQRVQVSVANSREPLVGTLAEATADGLILEQPGGAVPIAYGRVTAIDRLT
jgi:hypothetical protein